MNKEQLLAQLTDLHATMVEVDSRGQKLDMSAWITKLSGTKDSHFCGTVACWCGWQSLGGLRNFPRAAAERTRSDVIVSVVAEYISDELDKSCSQALGDSAMANSIYQGDVLSRWLGAKGSGLFSKEELTHPHLNKDPTPLEAANYALLCIEKVKAYE